MTLPLGRILIADSHHAARRGIRVLIDDLDRYRIVAKAANAKGKKIVTA